MSDPKTLTCKCGNDTYQVKWNLSDSPGKAVDVWGVCTECGRETSCFDPPVKRREQARNLIEGTPSGSVHEEFLELCMESEPGDMIVLDESESTTFILEKGLLWWRFLR